MRSYSFEKLEVWQEARRWVKWVYEITGKFPGEERFGLLRQIRRAAISVVSNIAEGCSRNSAKDQAHFSQISYSSLLEVLNHFIISVDLGFLADDRLREGRILIESLSFKVNSLRNSQLKRMVR